jgi:hypothetical protein
MTDWIRRTAFWQSYWHLGAQRTPHGVVVAHCGSSFAGDDMVETRPYDTPPPAPERCPVCQAAYWARVSQL